MSTSLASILQSGGYDLSNPKDAAWFIGKKTEIEELMEFADNVVEEAIEKANAEQEEADRLEELNTHSRFSEIHRNICDECRRDYDDFCQEQTHDNQLDELSEQEEREYL